MAPRGTDLHAASPANSRVARRCRGVDGNPGAIGAKGASNHPRLRRGLRDQQIRHLNRRVDMTFPTIDVES